MVSKHKVLTKAGVKRVILDHLQQFFPLHRVAQKKDQGIQKPVEANANEIDYKQTRDEAEQVAE